MPSASISCTDNEPPIYITTGPNKGWDITQIKEKNAFFLVRQALKKLYSRQELIEGMLSPRKDRNQKIESTPHFDLPNNHLVDILIFVELMFCFCYYITSKVPYCIASALRAACTLVIRNFQVLLFLPHFVSNNIFGDI